jgi:hypothetical protein
MNTDIKGNNKKSSVKSLFLGAALIATGPIIGGCAAMDSINETNTAYFESRDEFVDNISKLSVGMTKEEVLSILEMGEGNMKAMERKDIKIALYGSDTQIIDGTESEVRDFFSDLEGYQFDYESILKRRSLSGLLKVKTQSTGFDMSVTLIFKGDKLYENPIVSGGDVNNSEKDPLLKLDNVKINPF